MQSHIHVHVRTPTSTYAYVLAPILDARTTHSHLHKNSFLRLSTKNEVLSRLIELTLEHTTHNQHNEHGSAPFIFTDIKSTMLHSAKQATCYRSWVHDHQKPRTNIINLPTSLLKEVEPTSGPLCTDLSDVQHNPLAAKASGLCWTSLSFLQQSQTAPDIYKISKFSPICIFKEIDDTDGQSKGVLLTNFNENLHQDWPHPPIHCQTCNVYPVSVPS